MLCRALPEQLAIRQGEAAPHRPLRVLAVQRPSIPGCDPHVLHAVGLGRGYLPPPPPARLVAAVCTIFISFTYVAGQMRGVGVVFSRFLEVPVDVGVVIGMSLVFLYATFGGMRGITYTQVAQYVVLIVAYLIPAAAISWKMTGNPIPQIGFGGTIQEGANAGQFLLETLDHLHRELGLPAYTAAYVPGKRGIVDVFAITLALMVGTAGLPHVLIRLDRESTRLNFRQW